MPQPELEVLFREQADYLLMEHVRRFSERGLAKNKHFHAHLEIYYLIAGERDYYIRGRNFRVRPGDLVVISGNVMHQTLPVQDKVHERILLEIYTPMLSTINRMFGAEPPEKMLTDVAGILHLPTDDREYVVNLLQTLAQEMQLKKYGHETIVRCVLAELLAFIVRRTVQEPSEHWESSETKNAKILEISNYLVAHSSEKIVLDELAQRFSISKFHLCRTFREVTGFTISEYVNASRVMRARELMMTTDLSIAEVAKEVGFESNTHFGKVFKQQMGKTPMYFRKYG